VGPYFYPIQQAGGARRFNAAMRFVRAMLLLAIGAGAALAVDRLLVQELLPTSVTPGIERTERGPNDPPLVWISGSLEEVGETQLILGDGEGPPITVERFSGGATRFYAPEGEEWRELEEGAVEGAATGEDACIEALADGEAFLAIRVFLERTCAPV
jgi:hypothetical protein